MQSNEKDFKKNVLVLDPDREFCKNVGMFLEDRFNVYIREDVESLDYTILLNQIQLMLVNVDNADAAFLEELSHIKKNHPEVKILFMYTIMPEKADIRLKIKKLADASIAKPFDVELLRIKMECLLRDVRSTRQFDFL
ncbi:MAG TPA: hypothetical protein ENL21_07335 [Caldithrix abyssi]|uniref:Response regulatory domain-containing protein n=1 Tax=Caldithrix abyssi TaxID=187145 RepID=A0A7V5H484_CALAY|nr:hypothetical protein [Caldithrix abyssi]